MGATPTIILLVDDNEHFRTAMKMLLRAERSFQVIGETADGATGVRLAVELLPDVVLMDVVMPGAIDGIEATRQVLDAWKGHAGVELAL